MARPLRLEGAGYWFHVTGRGNARGRIFLNDGDRRRFVELLGEIEARCGLEVHCYVLMSNHYHLLLRMKRESGLSAGMQWLGVSYTVWFNRRHRRRGHLFEGRFKAILVEFESWGAELSRYIHLNPVRIRRHGLDKESRAAERAGLGGQATPEIINERLKALRVYPWSSYPNHVRGKPPSWLHIEAVLSRFCHGAQGRSAYQRYVEEAIRSGLAESPLEEVKAGFVLGGEELLEGDDVQQPPLFRRNVLAADFHSSCCHRTLWQRDRSPSSMIAPGLSASSRLHQHQARLVGKHAPGWHSEKTRALRSLPPSIQELEEQAITEGVALDSFKTGSRRSSTRH